VTKPLAIVFHETLLPGSQIANRLTDLGWRVQAVNIAANVPGLVRREKPMVLIAELALRHGDFCGVITELKRDEAVAHIPVIGYTPLKNKQLQVDAVAAGAKLVAANSAILEQLPQLLEYALAVD
jgi:CheY-like chemotaxis protein